MGKVLTDNLIQKLLYYDADVYVSLDNDARETQQRMLKKLLSYGLDSLHYVNLPEKDPSQMGRLSYWQYLLTNSKKYSGSTELELMKNKVGRLFK